MAFVSLLAFLALLLIAARYFVDGISGLATRAGAPPLVIGMTVVAFGTSTPELVVNSVSAMNGSTSLAFGNIIGSCLVNIGFVLGVTALIRPLKVEDSIITREIPMLILAVAALLILAFDQALNGAAADTWSRSDGLILLLLFTVFLYYTTRQAISARRSDAFIHEVDEEIAAQQPSPLWKDLAFTIAGLVGVSFGADGTVDSAVTIARSFQLSEAVIGMTIISLGTTLPELVTCVLAARKGNPDIALGNVIGSNLFNILCIGGIVSVISPIPIPPSGYQDLQILALLTVILFPIAIRSGRQITRGEGAVLLLTYAAYLTWRLLNQ
jgi:cation:H+ antiporter